MITLCTLRKIFDRERFVSYIIAGLVSTPLIVLERSSRVVELNIYAMTKVVESVWRVGKYYWGLDSLRNLDMLLSPFVMGTLVDLHQTKPDSVNGIYRT
ncbi:hypothetical protein HK098_000555, partial [Nowakowskiella sp. JEL0407]